MASPSRNSGKTAPEPWNPTVRSVITVLLVIHFTCVFVVLSSNNFRSPLQNRLVRLFGAYTQLLNFDPNFSPFALTSGEQTDDAAIVVELYADRDKPVTQQKMMKAVTLPDHGSKWLDGQKRYFSLGRLIAYNSDPMIAGNGGDDITAEVARAVGKKIMTENGAQRCVVRCLRRASQPMNIEEVLPGFPRDNPEDPRYDTAVYEADVWLDEDNQVQAIKRSAANEVAPRQSGS